MKRTHLSLYYLVTYLILGGLGLLVAPQLALKLFFSNGDYGDVLPRFLGVIILALGIVVFQIVRLQIHALYTTTLLARSVILVCIVVLYFYSHDPLFLTLLAIVGLGFILTGTGYLLDLRASRNPTPRPGEH